MKQTQRKRFSLRARRRPWHSIERIDESLQREQERRQQDPEYLLLEQKKLTRVRLALFGCAPA